MPFLCVLYATYLGMRTKADSISESVKEILNQP